MSELSKNVDRLFQWLVSIGLPPSSGDVRIVEIRNGIAKADDRGRFHVWQEELRKPSDYEGRFEELLQMGFSWLNLSCAGVYRGSLIVSVEVPANPALSKPPPPYLNTPVNLSGPSNYSLDHGWSVDRVLVIESESKPS